MNCKDCRIPIEPYGDYLPYCMDCYPPVMFHTTFFAQIPPRPGEPDRRKCKCKFCRSPTSRAKVGYDWYVHKQRRSRR